MSAEYIDSGNDDGSIFGRTSGKIGFYGTTPAAQPTNATAVSTASATTGSWGFATSTQADDLVTAVNTLIDNMATLGLAS